VLEALSGSGSDEERQELVDKIAAIDQSIAENDYRTGEHPSRLCVRHQQYRFLRTRSGQDWNDQTP
jgi:hypothetical protein